MGFTQTKCYKKIKVMMFVMPTIQLCINFGVLHCFLAHLNPYHLFHPLDIKVGGKKRQHETESVCICPASWLMRKCTQHLYIDKKTNKHYLSQRDANGSCPAAHIQYYAVLIQLGQFPHSRVQHLCSSCIHLAHRNRLLMEAEHLMLKLANTTGTIVYHTRVS